MLFTFVYNVYTHYSKKSKNRQQRPVIWFLGKRNEITGDHLHNPVKMHHIAKEVR